MYVTAKKYDAQKSSGIYPVEGLLHLLCLQENSEK